MNSEPRSLRILIIQPWIKLGGAELVSVHLAHELTRMGHDASIACTFLDLAGMPDQAKSIDYLLPPRWMSGWLERSKILFLILSPWILLYLVWKHSSDVDILNPHEFPSTWIAVLVGYIRRIPVVWSSYGPTRRFSLRDAPDIGFFDWMGWMFASSFLDRILVKRINAIHVPSEKSLKLIRKRYGCEATVIPLGVDEPFYSAGKVRRAMESLNIDGKFILLCVGKLHPQENQLICLEAVKAVLPRIPNVFLIIAGDGPMAKQLKKIAKQLKLEEYTKFVGHIPSWEIRDLYKACSINLFPPIEESWGLTPFEALCAQRISIISTDCGAVDVIAREGIGVVCEPNSESFASRIIEIHERPKIYEEIAIKGHRYVSRHLTWECYSKSVFDVMGKVRTEALKKVNEAQVGEWTGL